MADRPSSTEAPLWPGPADVSARLDRLEKRLVDLEGLRPAVEAALVAQAARIESMLAGARRDLGEVATVDDHVRSLVAGLSSDADDRHDALVAAFAATRGPIDDLAVAVDTLRREVAGLREDASDDRGAEALRDQLQDVATAGVDEVRRAGEAAVAAVSARLDAATDRLDQVLGTVGALEATLARHLAELDRRQALERARLAQAFAEQLTDGLGRRERRRLARRLEVPDPVAPANGDAPVGVDPTAPSAPRALAATPVPVRATGPAPAPVEEAEEGLVADDVPMWEDPGPADELPPRVRPSRRDRPVRRTASDPGDPAAVRRALAAVRGLGPARQSALIDRFGTLEAIRDATDDDLLAVRGVGPALLPGIRDAVG